ncbi:MAG: inverse autotransporter beta domain-containing protein [Candidatus Omnitrophota bacterium]|nr:inverse autotransporter beta domain-containing protein [Candidatus Omnitrophota bacterium]
MKKILFFAILLVSTFWAVYLALAEDREVPEWLKRTNYGLAIETDQKPRIYLETVQPLYQSEDKVNTFFTHDRITIQDERGTYSGGLGFRKLMNDGKLLGGINSFFDYQDLNKHYRTGIGIEALTSTLEFRTNSYIGLSPKRIVEDSNSCTTYEKAVDGMDMELGMPVPHLPWMKVFAQYYYYDYNKFEDMKGSKFRAEIKPLKFLVCNLETYDDTKGDREYRMDTRFNLAFDNFTPKSLLSAFKADKEAFPAIDLKERTLDRVERNFNIQVEKWREVAGMAVEVGRK